MIQWLYYMEWLLGRIQMWRKESGMRMSLTIVWGLSGGRKSGAGGGGGGGGGGGQAGELCAHTEGDRKEHQESEEVREFLK